MTSAPADASDRSRADWEATKMDSSTTCLSLLIRSNMQSAQTLKLFSVFWIVDNDDDAK